MSKIQSVAIEMPAWREVHSLIVGELGEPVTEARPLTSPLRCLVSYRAIAGLAHVSRERQAYGESLGNAECTAISAILDRLQAADRA